MNAPLLGPSPLGNAEFWAMVRVASRNVTLVLTALPILLAILLFNRYFFKSAEGIDGAING